MEKPGGWNTPVWKYAGLGLELAASVALLTLSGWWVDGRFGIAPWGVLTGALLGLVGGMYNLIRESLAAVRDSSGRGAGGPVRRSAPEGRAERPADPRRRDLEIDDSDEHESGTGSRRNGAPRPR